MFNCKEAKLSNNKSVADHKKKLNNKRMLLPESLLSRRESLPLKPEPVILTGRVVRLEPLVIKRDSIPLWSVSNGTSFTLNNRSIPAYDANEMIWQYLFDQPSETPKEMANVLNKRVNMDRSLCFCVTDIASNHQIGVMNYVNNYPEHLRIEMGGIWFSPIARGGKAATEGIYLMLNHAFAIGYRRVEWKCDALNERSAKTALRIGFTYEGIQKNHMIIKDQNRDTKWFGMIIEDWPQIKKSLQARLHD